MDTSRPSTDSLHIQTPSSSSSTKPGSPTPSGSSIRQRTARIFKNAHHSPVLFQPSPLVQAVTLDHFKAGSCSCPEFNRTGMDEQGSRQNRGNMARRPSTSQPVTPPRSSRIRDRIRWHRHSRSSSTNQSPSPRILTPPTFRESSERRRRARDSSLEEGPGGQEAACHDKTQMEPGELQELAVAGVMVAVKELDRLSGLARAGEDGKTSREEEK